MSWITSHRDEMLREHGSKYTAAQFASAWGTTRRAVCGRAHRLGVSLYKERPEKVRAPQSVVPAAVRAPYPMKVKAAAVAAVMAGAGYQRAADVAGVSVYSSWTWARDPRCIAAGRAMFERAVSLAKGAS